MTDTMKQPMTSADSDAGSGSTTVATGAQADVLDQLLKPEVQQSLAVLIDNLPKLAEMVTVLTKTFDTVQSIATDRIFIEDMAGGMSEIVKPVKDKVKHIAAAAIEAGERSEADETTIGLFGLLRMLKDPQMQKMFRFTQAFLEITAQRQAEH